MSTINIASRVETWLSSTWHVKVPLTWLEACISWIQEENSGNNLSQAQINRQVFEQWLLTDLRDLEYPILPDCILDAPKGELLGSYSIQIDSLVDVSQPAYSQLQKLRGKNTVNEEVTASTQAFQKPWEAKPTRMLMLQLTDGMHQIQGMEYQPVPVLHSNLPPGTKITVQEDDFLLEEEMQRDLEEVPSVVMNRNTGLITERLPHTSRSSCNSSLNDTCEKDDVNERVKPAEATIKQKTPGRTVFDGNKNNMSSFSEHKSIHQTCSYIDFSLAKLSEEQNGTGLDESRCKSQQTSDSRLLNEDPVFFSKTDQQKHDLQTFPCRAIEKHLDLDSLPFTYISLLLARNLENVTTLKVKCFIVTLTGNLTSANGYWGIKAKISDGSAYLEVDFADDILTSLIGFSVLEMNRLKKDTALHLKLKDGLEKCQKELIDLCCLMTIEFDPHNSKATVLMLQDADARHLEQLKKRLNK
ncbi:recQ-mediated genome instability protein 1 isoform X2 [Heliangelus exortis]|uniref:recQ-mediated genome instability protein 1 isoform X2 n=1 Tax=Heliangelus exortis TaxID=472823 RepID=UPI003A95C067